MCHSLKLLSKELSLDKSCGLYLNRLIQVLIEYVGAETRQKSWLEPRNITTESNQNKVSRPYKHCSCIATLVYSTCPHSILGSTRLHITAAWFSLLKVIVAVAITWSSNISRVCTLIVHSFKISKGTSVLFSS